MKTDYIFNGKGFGSVGAALSATGMDLGSLRPYLNSKGETCVSLRQKDGKLKEFPLNINSATLRKEDWVEMDKAIVTAAQKELALVMDLQGAGLTYNVTGGLGKTILETETQGDITDATISMDALRKAESDRPEFDIDSLPLVITHKDFDYPLRQILASREGGSPLDTTTAELAGTKVAQTIEKLTLGLNKTINYGGGSVYGLTNYPKRITQVLTAPGAGTWKPKTTVNEVLQMVQKSVDALHRGPWNLYFSPGWNIYLDDDYTDTQGSFVGAKTLRERLAVINRINKIATLDFLPDMQILLVQMSKDVVRMVNSLQLTTVQWDEQGGFKKNFKVLASMTPQVRADFYGRTGIVHGAVA